MDYREPPFDPKLDGWPEAKAQQWAIDHWEKQDHQKLI